MVWIESHQALREHAKTRKAAKRLGIPRVHLVGHLHTLWWWAMDHAEDGDVSEYDAEDLALAADWDGDAEEFVAALTNCGPGGRPGFLEVDGLVGDPELGKTAPLALRNWWTYAGKLIARRQHDRERKRVARRSKDVQRTSSGRPADTDEGAEQDTPPHNNACPADVQWTSTPPSLGRATEPDRTQPTEQDQTNVKGVSSRKRAERATRIPDAWVPADEPDLHGEAKAAGVDLHRELDRFRDYWQAKGGKDGRKVSWQATWRNWVRRAIDDRPRANGARAWPSHADRYEALADELERREARP